MRTILCFGDSNTWGYIPGSGHRYASNVRWTGRLQAILGDDYRVIEEGLNGRTTVWDEPFRPGRNGSALLVPIMESHAPLDLLILFLGTNDLKHFYHATAYDSARGMQTLLGIAGSSPCGLDNGPPAILLIIPPVMATLSTAMLRQFEGARDKSLQFSDAYLEIARSENCPYLETSNLIGCSPLDGIHLDLPEHAKLADAIASKIPLILPD